MPTISPAVLHDAASSGAPIGVFILSPDRRIAETVRVIAIENETARLLRNGVAEVVDLDMIGDPQAIRRRVNGDNRLSRLLDRVTWI